MSGLKPKSAATVVMHRRLNFPIMTHYGSRHDILKARAALWLEDLGLTAYVDVPVRAKNETRDGGSHTVDVAGFTHSGQAVAVECGDLKELIVYRVMGAFLAFYHWPYATSRPHVVDECEGDGYIWEAALVDSRLDLYTRDQRKGRKPTKWTNRGKYAMIHELNELANTMGGRFTSTQVADRLGISRKSMRTFLSTYANKGYIERVGEDHSNGRRKYVYIMGDRYLNLGSRGL